MLPDPESKRNSDPSRALAPAAADTPVADRDGPAVLPGSADGGSSPNVVAGDVLQHGKRGCNSVVRDHTAGRSKTPQYSRSSPAAGELFRPDSSCPPQAGTGQRQRIMAQLGPASMHGDPLQVANHSPRCFRQRGLSSYLFPPRMTNSTSSLRGWELQVRFSAQEALNWKRIKPTLRLVGSDRQMGDSI